jgi:protein-S-isoprenylcysteine O-methyltransferase Ste14
MEKRLSREVVTDLLARFIVGVLFATLSINLLTDFVQTHRVTGLWLLVSESLVVVLTILRRRTRIVDRSAAAGVIVTVSLVGPALLRTVPGGGLVPDALTALVSSIGLLIVIAGKITLGRSFGIAPANRGVVSGGPYEFVRHPIYAGYLLTHIAFGCAYPTVRNICVLILSDAALIIRALYEEKLLKTDRSYRSYCQRVGWHIVPGVF